MQRVLVLAPTDLSFDGRVQRQVKLLSEYSDVTVVSRKAAGIANIREIEVFDDPPARSRRWRKLQQYVYMLRNRHEQWYWKQNWPRRTLDILKQEGSWDVVVANDLDTLPIAYRLANGCRLVFDAHEFYPELYGNKSQTGRWANAVYATLASEYLKHVDGMMTTADEMTQEYRRTYGVDSTPVPNCPSFASKSPKLLTAGEPIKFIYHGACRSGRGIETAAKAFQGYEGRFELYFMLAGSPTRSVEEQVSIAVSQAPNIHRIAPVQPHEIADRISDFDVGLVIFDDEGLSWQLTTANKLFESLQARLGVAVGPLRAMQRITRQMDIGVCLDRMGVAEVRSMLDSLSYEDVNRFKVNAHSSAPAWCFEAFAPCILKEILGVFPLTVDVTHLEPGVESV